MLEDGEVVGWDIDDVNDGDGMERYLLILPAAYSAARFMFLYETFGLMSLRCTFIVSGAQNGH